MNVDHNISGQEIEVLVNKLHGTSKVSPSNLQRKTVVSVENIPRQLTEHPQWVCWKYAERKDKKGGVKLTKPPVNPKTGRLAKSNDPATHSNFQTAVNYAQTSDKVSGIGFVFTEGDKLWGIDIDHCVKETPEGLVFSPHAQDVLAHFKQSYCEMSPSGEGLRIFCFGKLPSERKSKVVIDSEQWPEQAIEWYDYTSPRYLTVTGNIIPSVSKDVLPQPDALEWLHQKYFTKPKRRSKQPTPITPPVHTQPPVQAPAQSNSLSDDDIITICQKARNSSKFNGLWSGGGDSDASRGDLSLCGILAFYTHSDMGSGDNQLDSIFRRSGRMRPKWDEKHHNDGRSYGQGTIDRATSGLTATYTKPVKRKTTRKKKNAHPLERPPIQPVSTDSNTLVVAPTPCSPQADVLNLKLNQYERPTNSLSNIVEILSKHPEWRGAIAYDELALGIVKRKLLPFTNPELGDWQDVDNYKTCVWIDQNFHFEPSDFAVQKAITIVAEYNKFHPVKEYLTSLKWDGKSRVKSWLEQYMGAENTQANTTFQSCFLISAVARVMRPGCKVDTVLIFEGPQGTLKSTALKVLFGDEWFTDSPFELGSKDGFLAMRGKWCIEMAELDKLKKAEASKAKAFFSQRYDEYRPPYGRNVIKVQRQCIFAGTVNENSYLIDPTGGRRYMPVAVTKINLEELIANRDQLWAEAYHLYQSGEPWWFDSNMDYIKEAQDERHDVDAWEEPILSFLDEGIDGPLDKVHTSQLQKVLNLEISKIGRLETNRIKNVMEHLGWKKGRPTIDDKRMRGYIRIVSNTPTTQVDEASTDYKPPLFPIFPTKLNQDQQKLCYHLRVIWQDDSIKDMAGVLNSIDELSLPDSMFAEVVAHIEKAGENMAKKDFIKSLTEKG